MEYKKPVVSFVGGVLGGALHEGYGYIDSQMGNSAKSMENRIQTWADVATALVAGVAEAYAYDKMGSEILWDGVEGILGAEGANMVYYGKALYNKSSGLYRPAPQQGMYRPAAQQQQFVPKPKEQLILGSSN